MREGDSNRKYFHLTLNWRRKKNMFKKTRDQKMEKKTFKDQKKNLTIFWRLNHIICLP